MITQAVIDRLLRDQSGCCWKCGRDLYGGYHVHHGIYPKSHTNFKKFIKWLSMIQNLFLVCPKCDHEHGYLSGYEMRRKGWADKIRWGYDMDSWNESIPMIEHDRFDA